MVLEIKCKSQSSSKHQEEYVLFIKLVISEETLHGALASWLSFSLISTFSAATFMHSGFFLCLADFRESKEEGLGNFGYDKVVGCQTGL